MPYLKTDLNARLLVRSVEDVASEYNGRGDYESKHTSRNSMMYF